MDIFCSPDFRCLKLQMEIITEWEEKLVMLAPVAVHADYFHQGIGSTMITMGIEKVKEMGFKGITVEGDYHFIIRSVLKHHRNLVCILQAEYR